LSIRLDGQGPYEPNKLREDIPEVLADLIKRCVALKKEDRYSSFAELREELTAIYRTLFTAVPPHATVKVTEARADILNNRGVSYWNLGNEAEARKCWKEALQDDPQHFETMLNLGGLRFNNIEIGSDAYLAMLKGLGPSKEERALYWQHLGWFYLRLGYLTEVEEIQNSKHRLTEPTFLETLAKIKNLKTHIFKGHTDWVYSVAFSPDGRYALSGSRDMTLRLWEVESGKEVWVFQGHTDPITSVAFSPNGRYALSGSRDMTLRLWEVESGKEVRVFQGHTGLVTSVAFSPDGRYALSGSYDTTLRFWEVASGKEVRVFQGHPQQVTSVAFSSDGRYVLSVSSNQILQLWEVASGKKERVFQGHTSWVRSIAFSPDGRYALSGSEDKTLRLWEVASGKEVRVFRGHTGLVTSVAFSPDGRYVLSSGSMDKTLRLWEVASGKEVQVFWGHTRDVDSVAFSPDGRYALSGSYDKTLRLWEVNILGFKWLPYLNEIHTLEDLQGANRQFQELL
jgi:WD40 repeat protein